jgi:hypothetical protein
METGNGTASNVKLQVESGDEYKLMEMEHQAPIDEERKVERKQKKAEYNKQYRLKRKLEMEQRASNVQLQVESSDEYK